MKAALLTMVAPWQRCFLWLLLRVWPVCKSLPSRGLWCTCRTHGATGLVLTQEQVLFALTLGFRGTAEMP